MTDGRTGSTDSQLGRWLFPPRSRQFPGKRWAKIVLRTLHLFGVAGIGGAYLYHAQSQDWMPFLWLTLLTGTAMVMIELWSHCIWLLQVRGMAIMIKLILLSVAAALPPSFDPGVIFVVILISGIISHAPSRQRYYSPFYGRKITLNDWSWGRPDGD